MIFVVADVAGSGPSGEAYARLPISGAQDHRAHMGERKEYLQYLKCFNGADATLRLESGGSVGSTNKLDTSREKREAHHRVLVTFPSVCGRGCTRSSSVRVRGSN